MATETVIFQDNNVSVSRSRIVFGSTTYSTANISSVTSLADRAMGIVLIILGALFALISLGSFSSKSSSGGFTFLLLGAGLIAVGIFLMRYVIVFHTNAGQIRAFTSRNKSYIQEVVQAVNDAIVARDEK